MQKARWPRYEAVPFDNQTGGELSDLDNAHQGQKEDPYVTPQLLGSSWGVKIFWWCIDLIVIAIAGLFFAFGFLAFKKHGKLLDHGSQAATIVSIANYV